MWNPSVSVHILSDKLHLIRKFGGFGWHRVVLLSASGCTVAPTRGLMPLSSCWTDIHVSVLGKEIPQLLGSLSETFSEQLETDCMSLDDCCWALLTCFAVFRHGLPLSSRIDRNHSCCVDSVRLQILKNCFVGASRHLDLHKSTIHRVGLFSEEIDNVEAKALVVHMSYLPSLDLLQLQEHRRPYTGARYPQQVPRSHPRCWWWGLSRAGF